jgi:hypothetical protein
LPVEFLHSEQFEELVVAEWPDAVSDRALLKRRVERVDFEQRLGGHVVMKLDRRSHESGA